MRILAAILLALVGVSAALAQTPEPPPGMNSSVIITVITSENGTNGNLNLELSGTFPGDPISFTLDQPGDLQPGMVNSYNFIVPHTFCEMFQFKLTLDGNDDWLGQQVSITIDGAEVWFDNVFYEGGGLTAGSWRGGTWDGTDAYQSHCSMTPAQVTFVTGTDGTVDNPVFYLQGDFSASPYAFYMDQPGDLQIGQTDTYSFLVPMGFCQMTGWKLVKGTTGGVDDTWLANENHISIDSTEVYFDTVFYETGPITYSSNVGGTWNGTEAYQSRCPALHFAGGLIALSTPTPVPFNQSLRALATPTQVPFNQSLRALATPTPLRLGALPLLATATLPAPAVQCPGAPAPRLVVGGQARVVPGLPNRLRAEPTTSAAILTNIPPGGIFVVTGGPTCAEGYTWWQVNYNGSSGWTVEGSGNEYFVEPI